MISMVTLSVNFIKGAVTIAKMFLPKFFGLDFLFLLGDEGMLLLHSGDSCIFDWQLVPEVPEISNLRFPGVSACLIRSCTGVSTVTGLCLYSYFKFTLIGSLVFNLSLCSSSCNENEMLKKNLRLLMPNALRKSCSY